MTSPGIRQALARAHQNEIARRAARPGPMHTPDAPRADPVGNLVAVALGNRRRERRAAIRATDWEIGRRGRSRSRLYSTGFLRVIVRTALVLALLVAALLPAAASAAPPPEGGLVQLPPPNACLANTTVAGCTGVGGLFNFLTDVDVSPDGGDVYVADQLGGVIGLRRTSGTGALTVNTAADQGFEQVFGVAVDPGGTRVAMAAGDAGGNGRVGLFPRAADGKLGATPKCAVELSEPGCTEVDGLSGARQVALPPSGPGIYVSGETGGGDGADAGTNGDGALVALARNAATGELSQLACVPKTPSAVVGDACNVSPTEAGVGRVRAVAVSPDGRHAYAGGFDGLVGFNRDGSTGNLGGRSACLLRFQSFSGCPQDPRIAIPEDIAFSPDGRHVYVAARDRVVVLARQPLSGALTFVECLNADGRQGCLAGAPGLSFGVSSVAVSPDGRTVYAAGSGSVDVRSFRRDATTGRLTHLACVSVSGADGCSGGPGLQEPTAVAVSPEGANAYVASNKGTGSGDRGAIALFSLEHAPACTSAAVTVAAGGTVTLPLACADPDGDPLARRVAGGPADGSLGAIDQAAGTVAYTAAAGFSGVDDVAFTASDGTNASPPAHVAITVIPQSGAGTPAPVPTPSSQPAGDRTAPVLSRLGLSRKTFVARRGTKATFRLSETAKVRLTFERARRRGGRVEFARFARIIRSGVSGANKLTLRRKIRARRLTPGRYRLTLRATDAAGNRSNPVRASFTVKR